METGNNSGRRERMTGAGRRSLTVSGLAGALLAAVLLSWSVGGLPAGDGAAFAAEEGRAQEEEDICTDGLFRVDENSIPGDGAAVSEGSYMDDMARQQTSPGEPQYLVDGASQISADALVRSMLGKLGLGYSQTERFGPVYYDCSSIIYSCLKEIGVTSYIPTATVYWESWLVGKAVGDTITFSGPGGSLTYRLAAKNVTILGNPELFETPGTIMIHIPPDSTSGHSSVSLGSFPRQLGGYIAGINPGGIVNTTRDYVKNILSARYGIPLSSMGKSSYSVPGGAEICWMDTRHLGTDILVNSSMTGVYAKTSENYNGRYSGTYNPIWRVEDFSEQRGVCFDNSPYGPNLNQVVRYVLTPVGDVAWASRIEVESVSVSDVNETGYTVTAVIDTNCGLKEVRMPTWTEKNGQDDIVWHTGSVSGTTAVFRVEAAAHNGESGLYHTHVYAVAPDGTQSEPRGISCALPAPAAALPRILDAGVDQVTSDSYRVVAVFQADAGVSEVLMPTWTAVGGQDDLVWHKAEVTGNQAVFTVNRSAHRREGGLYITHIYLYDSLQRMAFADVTADLPGPGGNTGSLATIWKGQDYGLVFDAGFYLSNYADLRGAYGNNGLMALQHFVEHGMQEGRVAKETFNVHAYRNNYPDLNAAFGDDLPSYFRHYIQNGHAENRSGV